MYPNKLPKKRHNRLHPTPQELQHSVDPKRVRRHAPCTVTAQVACVVLAEEENVEVEAAEGGTVAGARIEKDNFGRLCLVTIRIFNLIENHAHFLLVLTRE